MVKVTIVVLLILALILGLGIFEQSYLKSTFDELTQEIAKLANAAETTPLKYEDFEPLDNWFKNQKRLLHIFIDHTDLNEIEQTLALAQANASEGLNSTAKSYLTVALETSRSLYNDYKITFQNIF